MTDVFNRIYELYISKPLQIIQTNGDIVASSSLKITNPIHMTADIKYNEATSSGGNNSTVISIYNLSDKTLSDIKARSYVLLKAGYGNQTISTLYVGVIDRVVTQREGNDKVTTLTCTEASIVKKSAPFNRTFVKGETYLSVLLTITAEWQAWGVPLGEIYSTPKTLGALSKDLTLATTLEAALSTVCNMAGLVWYIVNGNLFIEDKQSTEERLTNVVVIEPHNVIDRIEASQDDTTLVAGQESLQGVRIRTFLNPLLDISKRFKVTYGDYAGLYKVDTVSHSLSWHDGDWVTEIEGTPTKYALNKDVSFNAPIIGEFIPSK